MAGAGLKDHPATTREEMQAQRQASEAHLEAARRAEHCRTAGGERGCADVESGGMKALGAADAIRSLADAFDVTLTYD